MVAPFLLQRSASQVSLPPTEHHTGLKSKVSLSSLAKAMRKKEFLHQSYPALPKSYTKAYGPCTLTLNAAHEASSGLPIFSNGGVISGSLEISKISKMLHSIQIMVTIPTRASASVRPSLTSSHRLRGVSSFRIWGALGLGKSPCFPTCFTNGAVNTTHRCRRP